MPYKEISRAEVYIREPGEIPEDAISYTKENAEKLRKTGFGFVDFTNSESNIVLLMSGRKIYMISPAKPRAFLKSLKKRSPKLTAKIVELKRKGQDDPGAGVALIQMTTDMKKIFAETIVKEHSDDYSIVFIEPRDEEKARTLLRILRPYSSVTYTGEEVSVVLRSDDWEKLKANFPGYKEEGPYRLITFDIVLDLSIVGFLSVVSTALAESGVSIYAISTYLKDHILVKKRDATKAIAVLNDLVSEAKRG